MSTTTATNENKSNIDNVVDRLKTTRDELKVKSNLFQKELGNTWNQAEQKWQEVDRKMQTLKNTADQESQELKKSLNRLTSDIKSSYEHIKEQI